MRKKKFLVSVLLCIFAFCLSVPVYAYISYPNGHTSAYLQMTSDELGDEYSTAYSNAKSAWNSTDTDVNIVEDTSPNHVHEIYSEPIDDTFLGEYSWYWLEYVFWGRATTFGIRLNDSQLLNESDSYKQSVIVHEFGHALCLGDNPPESPSIMRYDRDRETCITPQQDDIDGVNNAY